jgi:hypothetical protein
MLETAACGEAALPGERTPAARQPYLAKGEGLTDW